MAKDIIHKDFILKVTFVGSNAETHRDNVPIGLMWSTSFECPFVYLPDALAQSNLFLPEFLPPSGTRSAVLSIAPWTSAAPEADSTFSEMVLETTVVDRPTVIIGEEA